MSSPLSKTASGSLHPTLLGKEVSTPVFLIPVFWPCKTSPRPLLWALFPSPSVLKLFPTSQIQSVLDRHALFPLLTVSDLLSQPDQQICFSHPPFPCQSASFSFLHSLTIFLVYFASPGPPSPHCFPPTSHPIPQLLCWISCHSPNCLSLSGHLLPSAFQSTFSHLLTLLTGGHGIKSWGAQISSTCKLQDFFQNWANFGQILTRMIKDASLTESPSCLWQSLCSQCRAWMCYQWKLA